MKKPHILFIDSDHFLRGTYARRLQESGCSVAFAANPNEAESRMKERAPNAVVCDIEMPGALKFIRTLKEKADNETPVLCLSNAWHEHHKAQAHAAGAREYLLKAHCFPGEVALTVQNLIS